MSEAPNPIKCFLKNPDREYIQKNLEMYRRLSLIFAETQSCYISSQEAYKACKPTPENARMVELGQHVRLPAWGSWHRTCVRPCDFPQICRLSSSLQGVDKATVLIRHPLSAQRKEAEYERRWKRRRGWVWGNESVKYQCGCPKNVTALKATCE